MSASAEFHSFASSETEDDGSPVGSSPDDDTEARHPEPSMILDDIADEYEEEEEGEGEEEDEFSFDEDESTRAKVRHKTNRDRYFCWLVTLCFFALLGLLALFGISMIIQAGQ